MGPKTTRLVGLLEAAEYQLRAKGETHWADWLQRDIGWLREGDTQGLRHFLRAFGGMGSLNDLPDGPAQLSECYDLAKEILREVEAG